MNNRNLLQKDPFSSAKQHFQLRLIHLEDSLLQRFPAGPQREMMRATIRQLLDIEPSLQGKINRLLAIAQQTDISSPDQYDTAESQSRPNLQKYGYNKPSRSADYQSYLHTRNHNQNSDSLQFRQYLEGRNRNAVSPQGKPVDDNWQYSNYNSMKRQHTLNSQKDFRDNYNTISSQGSNRMEYANLEKGEDSINQKDIFSFRTQENGSPLGKNKQPFMKQKSNQIYKKDLSNQNSPRSKSRSSKNSKQKSSNKQSRKKSPKPINYDGQGLVYSESRSRISQSKLSASTSPNKKNRNIDPNSILKKISNRIRLSKCVVDQIDYSHSAANSLYLHNRHSLEQQTRRSLIHDLLSCLSRKR